MKTKMNLTAVDRVINTVFPKWGFRRMQYKQALNLMSGRSYEGAAKGRRTSGWIAQSTSANTEIHNALSFLRNRSRDLVRNNPYAKRAIKEIANNVVGTGILPTPQSGSKPQDKKIKTAWKAWADSTMCDYDGHLNFYGMMHLIMRTVAESGECIIRRRITDPKNSPFPLQLQVMEPDFIDTTKWEDRTETGGYVYYGVEFNSENKIVAYWLWEAHPGDNMQRSIKSNRVPADEIIHVFEKERPGQFRGVPTGHASMLRLKDFDEYEDAQLIRQKIAQCFTVFITDNSVQAVSGLKDSDDDDELERVEPGIIERLPAGKSVTMATPPDAGQSYDPYTKGVLRGVAVGYGMDYVTLTGDLTGVNFSSGRMGWLMFHRNVQVWQWNMLIPMFCDKAWQWFMQVAVITGASRSQMVPVQWTPPRREMIDPTKEVSAQIDAIRGGLQSWQETVRENGGNPEDSIAEMIADKEMFDKAGLQPECDPRFDPKKQGATDSGKGKKADNAV